MHGEFQSGGVASIQEWGKRKIDSIEVRCASGNAVMLSTAGRDARYANRACRLAPSPSFSRGHLGNARYFSA